MRRSEKRKLRRKIREKIVQFLPLILIMAFVALWIKYILKWDDLQRHHDFATGTILKYTSSYRGGNITYIFKVAGKEYEGERGFSNVIKSRAYLLEGKNFPVVFDTQDTSNNAILISPKAFEEYKIPFPDSLDWARKCISVY